MEEERRLHPPRLPHLQPCPRPALVAVALRRPVAPRPQATSRVLQGEPASHCGRVPAPPQGVASLSAQLALALALRPTALSALRQAEQAVHRRPLRRYHRPRRAVEAPTVLLGLVQVLARPPRHLRPLVAVHIRVLLEEARHFLLVQDLQADRLEAHLYRDRHLRQLQHQATAERQQAIAVRSLGLLVVNEDR